jgi:hypothetical protein
MIYAIRAAMEDHGCLVGAFKYDHTFMDYPEAFEYVHTFMDYPEVSITFLSL